ncbi:MAG: glycosyltransferase family 87 protein [Anaerolineales bacterium]
MTKTKTFTGWLKSIDLRYVFFIAIIAYYIFYWGNFQTFINDIDHCEIAFCDFVQFYYPAGSAILHHTPLPEGFYYSNFAAVLLAPLALFKEKTAIILWGVIQVILSGSFFLLISKYLVKNNVFGYLFTFLFFTSSPLINNFKWGQFSILIMLGIWGAYLLYENRKHNLSAILLGIMVAIKFFPALFLIPFILKKDWKYLLVCAATIVVCLFLIPLPFTGLSNVLITQPGQTAPISGVFQSQDILGNIDSQYFPSVIARFFNIMIPSSAFTLLTLASYLVVFAIIYFAYRVLKSGIPNNLIWVCALLFTTFVFWIPSAWPHYFIFIPVLQIMVLQEMVGQKERSNRTLFFLWVISVVLSSILIMQAVQNWYKYIGLGSLLWSTLAILAAISIIVSRTIKQNKLAGSDQPQLSD